VGATSIVNRLVLVVEAVVKSIETLSDQLTELGYRVVIARSGTEAVEKARRLQPCAVFLNPLLPTLSGWDVLTLLKAEPETREIPVIVTGTRGDREQAYRNHADGFLGLPVVQKSLQQVLNQITPDEAPFAIAETSPQTLVILRLSPTRYGELQRLGTVSEIDLNALLHSYNYRVVEADDLEQAELLAQVWKPNIVLLDAAVPDPMGYLKLLGDCSFLASLPLVTLDPATTQAANQVQNLSVFPCLAPISENSEPSALLQVIQVAAGFAWRPLVLAIELRSTEATDKRSDWLQAVMQYLQTAGFRGMIGRSWQDVLQKLDTQSIDLLLLHAADLDQTAIKQLSALKQFKEKISIVVINQHSENTALLEEIATIVLPPLTMEELLDHLNQLLTE
jgi:CheY-like chemotaxis protein